RGSYAVSGNYFDQDGAIRGSGFGRGGIRANLDRKLNSIVRISSSLDVTRSKANLVRSSGTEGTSAEGIVRGALRYSPLPNEAYDTSRLAIDPRAENLALSGILGANPLRYTDEVHESETVTRGLGGLRMFAQLLPSLSFETSIRANYERKGVDSYFPRTVLEGRNSDGLAIVSGSEYVNLVRDDLVRRDRELGPDHHVARARLARPAGARPARRRVPHRLEAARQLRAVGQPGDRHLPVARERPVRHHRAGRAARVGLLLRTAGEPELELGDHHPVRLGARRLGVAESRDADGRPVSQAHRRPAAERDPGSQHGLFERLGQLRARD